MTDFVELSTTTCSVLSFDNVDASLASFDTMLLGWGGAFWSSELPDDEDAEKFRHEEDRNGELNSRREQSQTRFTAWLRAEKIQNNAMQVT